LVRQVGQIARALFYRHLKTKFDQLGDHIGHSGNALFARENLSWDTNALRPGRNGAA
jgi:hypothetical protein